RQPAPAAAPLPVLQHGLVPSPSVHVASGIQRVVEDEDGACVREPTPGHAATGARGEFEPTLSEVLDDVEAAARVPEPCEEQFEGTTDLLIGILDQTIAIVDIAHGHAKPTFASTRAVPASGEHPLPEPDELEVGHRALHSEQEAVVW